MKTDKHLKVIECAQHIFLKHGYKRVTMEDIANSVGISRPSLYLIYPNKKELFKAIIKHNLDRNLELIQTGINPINPPLEKLLFAFDIWIVKPYILVHTSNDAKELTEFAQSFCAEIYQVAGLQFEEIIKDIIAPHTSSIDAATKWAKVLRGATRGFKYVASNADELNSMIGDFLEFFTQTNFLINSNPLNKVASK